MNPRRRLLAGGLAFGLCPAADVLAADDYPARPIKLVVPAPPGGGLTDTVSSPQRLPQLPDVPTMAETVPGFGGDSWQGLFAPRGTPAAAVETLAALSKRLVESADFRALLHDYGLPPVGSAPADFARFLAEDAKKWSRVVRDNKINVDG